jgi:hypothetical protein
MSNIRPVHEPMDNSFEIEVCRRSGADTLSCGLNDCEYGCDTTMVEVVPVAEVERLVWSMGEQIGKAEAQRDVLEVEVERLREENARLRRTRVGLGPDGSSEWYDH